LSARDRADLLLHLGLVLLRLLLHGRLFFLLFFLLLLGLGLDLGAEAQKEVGHLRPRAADPALDAPQRVVHAEDHVPVQHGRQEDAEARADADAVLADPEHGPEDVRGPLCARHRRGGELVARAERLRRCGGRHRASCCRRGWMPVLVELDAEDELDLLALRGPSADPSAATATR
jgi:hypothetical protein